MNPLLLKFLPYGLAAIALVGAITMYGARREAEGRMNASIESADRLQAKLTTDSIANVARAKVREDSLVTLTKTIAVVRVKQAIAARQADSTANELRATLTATQQDQLDTLVAAHQRERDAWAQEQMASAAKLRLVEDERDEARREASDLRQINASLRAATEAASPRGGASFVQRISPYVAGALLVVQGASRVVH